MSPYLLIGLLVVFAYYVLVTVANRSGALERRGMTLVAGIILMWRTRRGRAFIERLSGRGSRAQVLRQSIQEARHSAAEAKGELARAEAAVASADQVRRYWMLSGEAKDAREARAVAAEGHRGAVFEAPEARSAAEMRREFAAEMEAIEASVPQDSRLYELLRAGDDPEAEGSLAALVSTQRRRASQMGARMRELEAQLAADEHELERLESAGDADRMQRISTRRLWGWRAYGTASTLVIVFFMAAMFALLLWQAFIVVRIPPGVIKPQQMLGIPGINPVIPLWYGIFGLIVAMVVHELAHGVLSRVGDVPVKSLGLLFLVVPIGAFVEPDEDRLLKVDRWRRARVFAVGPVTNIIVAALSVMLFAWGFMAALEPAQDGVVLNNVVDKQLMPAANDTEEWQRTPASTAGLRPWSIITRIESLDGPPVGPAGSNASVIADIQDFLDTMDRTQAGQRVLVTWWRGGEWRNATVLLWDKGLVYPDQGFDGKGYIGASSRLIPEVPAGDYPDALAHPRAYSDGAMALRNVSFFYISLPFASPTLQPAPEGVTQAFKVTGPLSALGETWFWLLANLLYWVFWLNLMVGIFNSLPAIPLDGGYIFRDGLAAVWQRLRPSLGPAGADKLALRVTGAMSVLVLMLIVWQFLGPFMGAALGL